MSVAVDPTLRLARQIVIESHPRNIDSFAYFGDTPLGETHALTFSVTRDSDALDRSNWEVISSDLLKRFPRQVHVEQFSHFACGWLDRLVVQMLTKKGKVTKAGEAVIEWKEFLDACIIADSEHYAQLEEEEMYEYVKGELSYQTREYETDLDDDVILDRIMEYLVQSEISNLRELGQDDLELAVEYALNPDYRPPYWVQVANGQTELPL